MLLTGSFSPKVTFTTMRPVAVLASIVALCAAAITAGVGTENEGRVATHIGSDKHVDPFEIYCFHIHVYFIQSNNASVTRALELRQEFIEAYIPPGSTPCAKEVTRDRPCVWEGVNLKPVGPHAFASWGASLPKRLLQQDNSLGF